MAVKLSQLKADKLRMTIPMYIGETLVGDVEIYNMTSEQANELETQVSQGTYSGDEWRLFCFKECTNLDVDCEIDEEMLRYYSDSLVQIMTEIDTMIFEVITNLMARNYPLATMDERKQNMLTEITELANAKMEGVEEQLAEIELAKKEEMEKKEAIRAFEEARLKLQSYGIELGDDKDAEHI